MGERKGRVRFQDLTAVDFLDAKAVRQVYNEQKARIAALEKEKPARYFCANCDAWQERLRDFQTHFICPKCGLQIMQTTAMMESERAALSRAKGA